MLYTAYQLRISSELALPELHSADRLDLPADVSITFGDVPVDGITDGTRLGPFLWSTPRALWLNIPQVARFLVEDGSRIAISPCAGVDEASIRVFLLGSALGALLFQRGLLVLHGNAIRVGDACMVCVGASGAGKSTTAAGFLQRGHAILADDVVAIDALGRALPGFPRLKLWQETAARLDIETGDLARIRPTLEKYHYPLAAQFGEDPLPVRWIYVLGHHNRDDILFEPVTGMQRYAPLHEHTYRRRYLSGMALSKEHLASCGKLAGQIRMAKVTRPARRFCLDEVIERIQADMDAHR